MNRDFTTSSKQIDTHKHIFDAASSYHDSLRLSPVSNTSTANNTTTTTTTNTNSFELSTNNNEEIINGNSNAQTPKITSSPSSYELSTNRSHDGVFLRPGAVASR